MSSMPRDHPRARGGLRPVAALLATAVLWAVGSQALDNGLGLVPAMGYNTWDDFRTHVNASDLRNAADALVSLGLAGRGYTLVSLDDCWAKSRDPKSGVIQPDPDAFPDGMKVSTSPSCNAQACGNVVGVAVCIRRCLGPALPSPPAA